MAGARGRHRFQRTIAYTHSRLSPGSTRHYRVAAINRAGRSPWSSVAQATTEVTTPGAPTGLRVMPNGLRGSDQLLLTWSRPPTNGGSSITGYRIEMSPNGVTGWSSSWPAPAALPPATCTSISPPARPGSTAWPRSTPRGRGHTRPRRSEEPPTPRPPARPKTCARRRPDRGASPSPGRCRPATAGPGSPATGSSLEAPTTAPGSRSRAHTGPTADQLQGHRASSRQPPTGTRWRRSTAWEPVSGRSRRGPGLHACRQTRAHRPG